MKINIHIKGMRTNCPISMPILKNNKDKSISLFSMPISDKAPAKPKPCNKPNPKAKFQGLNSYFFEFFDMSKDLSLEGVYSNWVKVFDRNKQLKDWLKKKYK